MVVFVDETSSTTIVSCTSNDPLEPAFHEDLLKLPDLPLETERPGWRALVLSNLIALALVPAATAWWFVDRVRRWIAKRRARR
jgi:hypothetical protein